MKHRLLLVLIPVLLLPLIFLGGLVYSGWVEPVQAELAVMQKGFLPVVLDNYGGGSVPPTATPDPAPAIKSFTADRDQIVSGETVTLRWEVSGAISSLTLNPVVGDVLGKTSQDVSPTKTTVYRLTARSSSGRVASETVTINVAPTIDSFVASPDQIKSGETATLSWQITGDVTSLTITPGVGDVTGKTSQVVSPAQTTEYTLTAVNSVGQQTTATVKVDIAPVIVSFTTEQAQIESGQTATLNWQVTGEIASLTITPLVGDVTGKTSQVVSPTQTTVYTLTAENSAGQQTTAAVTVNVAPVIVSFTAVPTSISSGEKSTLSWQVTGEVTSLVISPVVGNVTGKTSQDVLPTATTVYTLTAQNSVGQQATKTVTVTVAVSGPPVIVSFAPAAPQISYGASTTLNWQVTGQDVSLTLSPGDVDVSGKTQVTVAPTQNTVYTLKAVNPGGTVQATTTVSLVVPSGAPQINTFVAWPSKPIVGQPTLLRWEVLGALDTLVLKGSDGSERNVKDIAANQISVPQPAGLSTISYTLTAANAEGTIDSPLLQVDWVAAEDVPPLQVYEWNVPVQLADKGFPKYQPPSANGNWRTPYDYAGGTLYFRAVLASKPDPTTDFKVQYCVWQRLYGDNFGLENCGPLQTISGSPGSEYSWNKAVKDLWKLGGPIEWERARYRDAFSIKTLAGCPVSNFTIDSVPGCPVDPLDPTKMATWAGEDPALWYPLDIHLTVYVVAKGDTFPGWGALP